MEELVQDIEYSEVLDEQIEEEPIESEEVKAEEEAPVLLIKDELDHLAKTSKVLFIIDSVVTALGVLFFLVPLILPIGKSLSSFVPVIFALAGLTLTVFLRNFNEKLKRQKEELSKGQRSFVMTTSYFVTAFLVINIVVGGVILAVPVGSLAVSLISLALGGAGALFTSIATFIGGVITVIILLVLAIIGAVVAAIVAFFVFVLPKITGAAATALLLL